MDSHCDYRSFVAEFGQEDSHIWERAEGSLSRGEWRIEVLNCPSLSCVFLVVLFFFGLSVIVIPHRREEGRERLNRGMTRDQND